MQRMIERDESVSENYKWLAWKTIGDVHGRSKPRTTIDCQDGSPARTLSPAESASESIHYDIKDRMER